MLDDITNYFADFNGVTNACRTVALWVTIALVVAFIATRLYVTIAARRYKLEGQALEATRKMLNGGWIAAALVVAGCIIIAFSTCYFVEVARGEDTLTPILFYPLLVAVLAVVGSAAAVFVKPDKLVKIICAALVGCAVAAVIVCMAVYYASGEAGEAYSNLGLYISAVLLAALVVGFAFFTDRNSAPTDTRTITYAAVCVALSFALSYVRIVKMPMGGSITFASMLPLMLFAYMFGSRKGVLVGLIYGILQAVQDPWIIHPAQFALDYAVAFCSIGLTGCLRELGAFKGNTRLQFALGACIACALRFLSHYFAGVFAFGMYGESFAAEYNMPALADPYLYSFVYQCLYIIPELIIVIVVGVLALSATAFRRQVELRTSLNTKQQAQTSAQDETETETPDQVTDAAAEQTGTQEN